MRRWGPLASGNRPSVVGLTTLLAWVAGRLRLGPVRSELGALGRWRWWADPYRLLVVAVLAWALPVVAWADWSYDFDLHLASLRGLVANPWTPVDPMVGTHPGSPYYSPYLLALAGLVRLTGLSPVGVFQVAAVGNLMLLLWAFRRFCRHLSPSSGVAAFGLLFTLLLWGLRPLAWSGFLGLFSLPATLPYPSVCAFGLMLLAWDALLRYDTSRRPAALVGLGGSLLMIVLVHPFTGLNTIVGLTAIAVCRVRTWRARDHLRLGLTAGGVVAAVWAWPYSSPERLLGASAAFAGVHRPLLDALTGDGGLRGFGLAALGVPMLALRAVRRDPLGPELALTAAGAATLVGYAAASGSYGFARALPVLMLPAHLALAAQLGEPGRPGLRPRPGHRLRLVGRYAARASGPALAAVTVLACVAGLYGAWGGLLWALPRESLSPALRSAGRLDPPQRRFDFLAGLVRSGTVVMVEPRQQWAAWRVNSLGGYTVSPSWPNPFIPDAGDRQAATARFFDPAISSAERSRIAARYRVDCVMVRADSVLLRTGNLPGFTQIQVGSAGDVVRCRSRPPV